MDWLIDLWHLNNTHLYINNLYIIMLIMFLFLVLNSFPIVYNRAKQYNKLHSQIFDELDQKKRH